MPADQGMGRRRDGRSLGLFCPTYSIRRRNHGIDILTDSANSLMGRRSRGPYLDALLLRFSRRGLQPWPAAPVFACSGMSSLLDLELAPASMIARPQRRSSPTPDYRSDVSLRRAVLIDYRAVAAHSCCVLELLANFSSPPMATAHLSKAFLRHARGPHLRPLRGRRKTRRAGRTRPRACATAPFVKATSARRRAVPPVRPVRDAPGAAFSGDG